MNSVPAGPAQGQLFLIHTKVPRVRCQEGWYQNSGPGEAGLGFRVRERKGWQQEQKVLGGEAGGQHRAQDTRVLN